MKDYFKDRQDKEYNYKTKTFTYPSTWTPPDHKISRNTLETIQHILTSTENILQRYRKYNNNVIIKNISHNLSTEERQALNNLRRNDAIVIKPADKGSATVVMNKSSYLAEAYRQLNNTQYYRKLPGPIYTQNITAINGILEKMTRDGYITSKQQQYLQANESNRHRIFYLLPKIHKPQDKWPQPHSMPEGRPIVSDTGSESYNISAYIDHIIRPISVQHDTFIKDTYHFVSKIRGHKIPAGAFLVTGDITSLYTNMNINRILDTTKQALLRHPDTKRPDKYILQLLELTLRNNDFTFNNEHFLQICGTAMGKCYAPALADIYLYDFDHIAQNGFQIIPQLFSRFLDDIFFIWTGTEIQLKHYESFLNSIIPGIHVKLTWSQSSVDFLDTTVYKKQHPDTLEEILHTRVYFKPTDTHQLLHRLSFHPKHTTRGVLKSQLIRFKRISSSHTDYSIACSTLFKSLYKRNYSKSLLRKTKRETWLNNIDQKTPEIQHLLPIVVPFNTVGTKLSHIWKNTISQNNTFNRFRLITSYSKGKNLQNYLVHSSLITSRPIHRKENSTNKQNGNTRCPNPKCKACNFIIENRVITSSTNNKKFQVIGNITCKSNNLVYLVTCNRCQKQYVGETSRTLAERINQHLSSIRLRKLTPIALHFNSQGHKLNDFRIIGIEIIQDNSQSQRIRRMKEITWQNLLQTTFPHGINNLTQKLLN